MELESPKRDPQLLVLFSFDMKALLVWVQRVEMFGELGSILASVLRVFNVRWP